MCLLYYKVYLKDGTCLDLDKDCDKVIYSDSKLCAFFDNFKNRCIAMIPYENISHIIMCEENVQ